MLDDLVRVALATAASLGACMAQATLVQVAPPSGHTSTGCSAVSADGTTIVGWSIDAAGGSCALTMTGAGPAQVISGVPAGTEAWAVDVSADGGVVVGNLYLTSASDYRGFRWTSASGIQVLHPLSTMWSHGPSSWSHTGCFVHAVSADGNRVIGSSGQAFYDPVWNGLPNRAVIWSAGIAQDLGTLLAPLPAGAGLWTYYGGSMAGWWGETNRGVDASGSKVLLFAEVAQFQSSLALWTSSGLVPLPYSDTETCACSDDGTILLQTATGFARQPPAGTWSSFPEEQLTFSSNAIAVNRDATQAVYDSWSGSWVWSTTAGLVSFDDFLSLHSVDSPAWTELYPVDIAADGRTIVGGGLFNGAQRGFVLRIPFGVEVCDGLNWASPFPPFALSRDTAAPRRKGVSRKGVCADGVSQLVIRCTVDAPGVFSASFLASGSVPDQGQLGAHGVPFSTSTPVVVTTVPVGASGRHDVEFIYKAPLDFARSPTALEATTSMRHVGVRIQYQEQGTSNWRYLDADIQVRRPPVVAAHGLWSDPTTWSSAFTSFETDPRLQWSRLDYEITNSASLRQNARLVGLQVLDEIRKARKSGFACSQVDWVGHSMGGLLPRQYYALARQRRGLAWERRENFGAGDIHKLILLNSPQHGSPWANLLCEWAEDPEWGSLLVETMDLIGKPFGGAVQDLAERSSALAQLGAMPVPSLAVVGLDGSSAIAALGSATEVMVALGLITPPPWGDVVRLLALARLAEQPPVPGVDDIYRGNEHDLIVLEASQRAGLPPQYASPGFNPPISGLSSLHPFNTSSSQYASRVLDLIHTPIAAFAPGLPAPDLNPLFASHSPSTPGGNLVQAGLALANSPPYVAGAGVVHLTVSGAGGFVPVSVTVFTPWGIFTLSQAPFALSVPVAAGSAGVVMFRAIGRDATGAVGSSSAIAVDLGTPGTLTALTAWPASVVLRAPFEQAFVRIDGTFTGGAVRSIGRPAFGTTFTSSSPGVASISPEGVVTALRHGVTSVTVGNGSHSTIVDVIVEIDPVTGYGDGLPGSGDIPPEIGVTGGYPVLGNNGFGVSANRVLGGALGLFIAGWDVARLPVFGGTLWVDPSGGIVLSALCNGSVGVPGDGVCMAPVPIPGAPTLVGLRIFWQAAFLDPQGPQGFSLTHGLVTSIVP
jgi:hypothetical protein